MADGKAKGRLTQWPGRHDRGVAEANDCVVVTDNERDFDDIEVINPVRGEM
jgi:toxin FitB